MTEEDHQFLEDFVFEQVEHCSELLMQGIVEKHGVSCYTEKYGCGRIIVSVQCFPEEEFQEMKRVRERDGLSGWPEVYREKKGGENENR